MTKPTKEYLIKYIVDFLFFCIGLIVISIVNYTHNKLFVLVSCTLPALNSLLSFSLPFLLTILPVVVAVTILVYQIYYNRYTLKELHYSIKKEFIVLYILLFTNIICVTVFWLGNEKSIFWYLLTIYYFLYLVIRLFIFIIKYNQLTISFYIKSVFKKCIKKIESKRINNKGVKLALDEINEYFTESIEKKENNYIRAIINIKKDLILAYLSNCNTLIIKKSISEVESEDIFATFVKSIGVDYRNLINGNSSKKILRIYSDYIIEILKSCVSCKHEYLYNEIIKTLSRLMFFEDSDRNNVMFFNSIRIIENTYESIVLKTDSTKWASIIEKSLCESMQVAELFVSNDKVLKEMLLTAFDLLSEAMEHKSNSEYMEFFNLIYTAVLRIIKHIDKGESEFVVIAFSRHFERIQKLNNQEVYDNFVNRIFDFVKKSIYAKNKELVLNIGYLLSDILSTQNEFAKSEKCTKKRCECILRCIEVYPDISIVYFPDYPKDVAENIDDIKYVEELKRSFCDIFDRLIRTDESEPLYYFVESLNDCIEVFEQKDRNQQELLFDVYEELLQSSIAFKAFNNFSLGMYKLNVILKQLDEKGKISDGLMLYILTMFDTVGTSIVDENDTVLQSRFLHTLTSLPDNISLVNKDKKYKERITEIIFHFGIDAIETKNDQLLKQCSNSLGWYALNLHKSGDIDNIKKIIESTVHLYNLAVDQKYDNSIRAFLGTLFIILGAYMKKKNDLVLTKYIQTKIESLKDKESLKTSKRLREYGHKYWDKTFDGDAKDAINNFYGTLHL